MAELNNDVKHTLQSYVRDVAQLPNEAAKCQRFASLVGELFRGSKAVTMLASGVEKLVKIDSKTRKKYGFIDALYGNHVIEFENSLSATLHEAEKQLREYSAGTWSEEGKPYRRLICVASDGLRWKVYIPRLSDPDADRVTVDDVELEAFHEFTVDRDNLSDFWMWLTGSLFRREQTNPTAERFQTDFGGSSAIFADAMKELKTAWSEVKLESEAKLAYDTWRQYLMVTYGSIEDESDELPDLFLRHTYLASIARFLIWAALSGGRAERPLRDVVGSIHSGDYFRSEGIENLVEDDFFQWIRQADIAERLLPVWEKCLDQMRTYDLRRLDQDVLRGVYQELIDPSDRHDLGEYYTPEWLCQRVVDEVLPNTGFPKMIDPTCGSGSFLYAAIRHMLTHNPRGGPVTRLREVLNSVVGIDIHPLAVTIARATYVLALRDLVKKSKRPVQIPVFMADSLFLPTEVVEMQLGDSPGFEIRFGGRAVKVPQELIKSSHIFDRAITAATKIATDHAAGGKESRASLAAYLKQCIPGFDKEDAVEPMTDALWRFTHAMADLIASKDNSIRDSIRSRVNASLPELSSLDTRAELYVRRTRHQWTNDEVGGAAAG